MKRFITLLFLLWQVPAYAGITCTLPFNLQNNTTADANQVMANYNALVTCFTNAAAAGVNADITALTALSTPLTPSQGGSPVYYAGTSTGSANAQVVASLTPAGFSLVAGKRATFVAGFSNTGTTTLNVNGTGVKNVFRITPSGAVAMTGGEIVVGNVTEVIYDGTQYQLLAPQAEFGGFGPLTTAASNSTVDLGTIASHNASITGTTTITSFGSSASTTYPVYQIKFTGILTLTYNATSLITPGAGNITTAANDTATVLYLGSGNWQVVSYTKATGVAIVNPTPLCGATGLVIANNAGTPNTSVDITAGSLVLVNPTGNVPIYFTSVSVTINDTVTGANALDAGSLANDTFYHHWLISNGSVVAGLDSLSATAPTMPSGYTYRCRFGASKTNGSANFYGFRTTGSTTQYTVGGANLTAWPNIVSGAVGSNCTTTTPTWSGLTVRGASGVFPITVPATATDIEVTAGAGNGVGDGVAVGPNASFAGFGSASDNQAPIALYTPQGSVVNNTAWMKLEADTIQVCAIESTRAYANVMGWRDAVNAN